MTQTLEQQQAIPQHTLEHVQALKKHNAHDKAAAASLLCCTQEEPKLPPLLLAMLLRQCSPMHAKRMVRRGAGGASLRGLRWLRAKLAEVEHPGGRLAA